MKRLIFIFCILIAALWHVAERREHAENVILQMSQEAFDDIRDTLGDEANFIQIADYYEQNRH